MLSRKEQLDAIFEKISIMIDILMWITKDTYTNCYLFIRNSKNFESLVKWELKTAYESPQATLLEIAKEGTTPIHRAITLKAIQNHILEQQRINKALKTVK